MIKNGFKEFLKDTRTDLLYSVASCHMLTNFSWTEARDAKETIESGPLCITDLFKNKLVAYFLFITAFV